MEHGGMDGREEKKGETSDTKDMRVCGLIQRGRERGNSAMKLLKKEVTLGRKTLGK